jgi:hypothetical protein
VNYHVIGYAYTKWDRAGDAHAIGSVIAAAA